MKKQILFFALSILSIRSFAQATREAIVIEELTNEEKRFFFNGHTVGGSVWGDNNGYMASVVSSNNNGGSVGGGVWGDNNGQIDFGMSANQNGGSVGSGIWGDSNGISAGGGIWGDDNGSIDFSIAIHMYIVVDKMNGQRCVSLPVREVFNSGSNVEYSLKSFSPSLNMNTCEIK